MSARAEADAQLKVVRGLAATFRNVGNNPQVVWASLQNLITMVELLPESMLPDKVWTVVYDHRHGTDVWAASDAATAYGLLATALRSEWARAREGRTDTMPALTDVMSDEDVVSVYFEHVPDEYHEIAEKQIL